ncbi:4Fe-4S dicluster domain-containing protein [Elusimicrobiota bacterium]
MPKQQDLNTLVQPCSGCGLCLTACPRWQISQETTHCALGRAKALQDGSTPQEMASSIDACVLCGACEISCPEDIATLTMNIHLRRELNKIRTQHPTWYPALIKENREYPDLPNTTPALFLGDSAISNDADAGKQSADSTYQHPRIRGLILSLAWKPDYQYLKNA